MAHDDQFTATGPAFSGAGFPGAAFSTNRVGTDSTYGVNVQGTECGVYGECLNISTDIGTEDDPSDARRANPYLGSGVCGTGAMFGVVGKGLTNAGVAGYGPMGNNSAVAGVLGVSGGPGVVGFNRDSQMGRDALGDGDGIIGASNSGVGLVGLSLQKTGFNEAWRLRLPDHNTRADGAGIGVMGKSNSGIGVVGNSNKGIGGVFTSNFAQMRLKPATTKGPPTSGPHERGEFFVDARGTLFYCVDEQPLRWTKLAGRSVLEELLSDFTTAVIKLFSRK